MTEITDGCELVWTNLCRCSESEYYYGGSLWETCISDFKVLLHNENIREIYQLDCNGKPITVRDILFELQGDNLTEDEKGLHFFYISPKFDSWVVGKWHRTLEDVNPWLYKIECEEDEYPYIIDSDIEHVLCNYPISSREVDQDAMYQWFAFCGDYQEEEYICNVKNIQKTYNYYNNFQKWRELKNKQFISRDDVYEICNNSKLEVVCFLFSLYPGGPAFDSGK